MTNLKSLADYPGYGFSEDGDVWSFWPPNGKGPLKDTPSKLSTHIHPSGYRYVRIKKNRGKSRLWFVHRLVSAAFLGDKPKGQVVCHSDGDLSNNRIDNLRYDTPKGNVEDRERHGKTARGEKARHKLLESQVREILIKHRLGQTIRQISAGLPVSESAVGAVVNRKSWKHIQINDEIVESYRKKTRKIL